MTAVEWLVEQFEQVNTPRKWKEIIEQAKEIEKQEKLESFIEGYKQRAEKSNLIFDNASRMYAINLFETFNLSQQDKP
jgi:predicted HTH domain antitoxin